jgi:hypothetical protein
MLVQRPPRPKVATHRPRLLLDLGVRTHEHPVGSRIPSGRERSCTKRGKGRV